MITYDERRNEAHFIVTPNGRILLGPGDVIDENDTVVVHVLAAKRLWDEFGFKVRRASPTRTLGTLSILGEGTVVRAGLEWHAREMILCEERPFPLSAFAPGTGKVEITLTREDKDVIVGDLEFLVHRLYDGMFSFGAVSGRRLTQSFGLAPQGEQNVIVAKSEGYREISYALFFTPFLWKRRDVEKTAAWWEHVNPTVGIAMENVFDHAYIGVSFDYKTLVFTGGMHLQRIDVLSSDSGLMPGNSFSGAADEIPVATKWERRGFVGISVDLRAAVSFLKTLGGGAQ